MDITARLIRVAEWLYETAYSFRRPVAFTLYGAVVVIAYWTSFQVRFDFAVPPGYVPVFWGSLFLLVALRIVVDMVFRISTGRWRFVGTKDVQRLVLATAVGSVAFFAVTRSHAFTPSVPRSVLLAEFVLTTFLTAGLWITYRRAYEVVRHARSGVNGSQKRALIVGAGEAGNLLAREMSRMPTGYRPIGFVDDDATRWGLRLQGLPVFGSVANLKEIARAEGTDELIIAVPSASPAELRRIVATCERTSLPFKVLPGIAEVLAGNVQLNQLREVRIEDLLGREPIQLTLPELAADLAGSSVLITGAAGSIGAELSRQVALHRPAKLVLFDQAETDLFYLELELREKHPGLRMVPVVGDIVEAGAMEQVFREHGPDRIFHAAAYKHVPMMQCNPLEAVRNNVIGTWRVADAAGRHGAEKFVLISTDKAVRPVSIMGATKRLAELVVLELQGLYHDTTYAAVRFGNVLGSSGSVIPIFKRQLAAGKPLTVTHPEATRYFMTIPEAVQLILQASLLAEVRGSIAMLEMGEPIRIADLAANLLELSGVRRSRGDHRIVYTGLRPGERLHEQLVAPNEETLPTANPKVRLVRTPVLASGLAECVERWGEVFEGRDGHEKVLESIAELFPEVGLVETRRQIVAD